MNKQEQIAFLLNRALSNVATDEELQQLSDAMNGDETVVEQITELLGAAVKDQPSVLPDEARQNELINAVLDADKLSNEHKASQPKAPVFSLMKKIAVAAVLMVMVAAVWLWKISSDKTQIDKSGALAKVEDRAPGMNKAMLTLSNGTVVILDSSANGKVASQGATDIVKLNSGEIMYDGQAAGQNPSGEILYNTITIPRGGQYALTLSDGTRVWLNASSTLRFPATFSGSERKVELNGEAYFEVAKNAAMPFSVNTNKMVVEVLGTHFNVMAYDDETANKATLLEGSVKIKAGEISNIIKPGQQAWLNKNKPGDIKIENVDVDEAIAWKNGLFQFSKVDESLMRQLSRWYDIDVQYEAPIKENEFKGTVARSIKLSNVVDALKISGIHCRIENNKLIVMP